MMFCWFINYIVFFSYIQKALEIIKFNQFFWEVYICSIHSIKYKIGMDPASIIQVDFYLITRIVIAIALGINSPLAIISLKHISYKQNNREVGLILEFSNKIEIFSAKYYPKNLNRMLIIQIYYLMPISKVFINSFVATMTLSQLSYSEIGVPIKWVQIESIQNTKINVIQTFLLQNGLFYFGCFVGTQITLLLQKQSNKFIFLLSDLLNLFANYNYFLLPQDQCFVYYYNCQSPPDIKPFEMSLNFYFIIRFLIAIALGINLTQAILYIKQLTYKAKKGYLFLLVPLQIQLGFFIGGLLQPYSINMLYFTYCSVTIIRMILLLILDFETPNYYYFVKQNIRATKQILSKIHDDEEIKKQIINKFRKQESQVLISRQLIKKSLLCVSLVIITQLSGFSILSAYESQYLGWVGNLMGLLVITTFIAFGKKINKSNQILVGQLIVCLGLGVFSFINSNDLIFTYFAISVVTIGHYTGLGSLIYQIIPILLPQLGIIDCMIALWTTNLAQMCIFGIFFYKQQHQEQYRQQFNDIIQMYFYFSCFGLLYLFFILRNHNKVEKEEEVNEEAVDTKIELVQNQVY